VTIRAALDANVFVSAAIGQRPSYRVVNAWRASQAFELIPQRGVLAEVDDVLARPRLAKWIVGADARAFVNGIRIVAELVVDPVSPPTFTRDPDDDYLIALARLDELIARRR